MPPTLELPRGNQNAFDRLLNWISILKVQGQDVADFERDALELERLIQYFDDESLTQTVNEKLDYWLTLSVLSEKEKLELRDPQNLSLKQFRENIFKILDSLNTAKNDPRSLPAFITLIREIPPNFSRTGLASCWANWTISSTRNFEAARCQSWLEESFVQGFSKTDLYGSTKPSWINREEFKNYQYQWEIFIKFSGDHHRAAKVSKVIWLLSEALESVSGVIVELEDQGNGSKWARLRVFIRDLLAKKEVIDVAEKVRDAAISEADKRIETVENLKAQTRKAEADAATIERQFELIPDSEEAKKIRELELKRKELEIRRIEAEIRSQELENYAKALNLVEKMGYLMREGMLNSEAVNITINGENYLSCQDGKFLAGATMEVIDQAGAVKPGEDESP